jgi:hypothetical protein
MAATTPSLTTFPLTLVGVTPPKLGAKSWFFSLTQPTATTLDCLHRWFEETPRVKFLCYAFETTPDGELVMIGYLDFASVKSLRMVQKVRGLERALWLVRNYSLNGITPREACQFIAGGYQNSSTGAVKPMNPSYRERGTRSVGRDRLAMVAKMLVVESS